MAPKDGSKKVGLVFPLLNFWNRSGLTVSLHMRTEIAAANSKNSRGLMTKSDNFKYVLKVVQMRGTGSVHVNIFRLHTPENIEMSDDLRQQSTVFEARFSRCRKVARFSRCRKVLYFLACRVLGSPEQAHDVVENCKVTASRNSPIFEYEGAFRSWLVRILIDEALAIVRHRKSKMTNVGKSLEQKATDKVRDHHKTLTRLS